MKPATVDRDLDVLSQTLSYADDVWKIAPVESPFKGLRRPKYFNEGDRRLAIGEVERLVVAARADVNQYLEPAIILALDTAMRRGELAKMLPAMRKPLLAIADRLFDLLLITREHYYHPDMRGSFSIKVVLPTLAPDLNYDNLEHVQDSGMAQQAWLKAVSDATSEQQKTELRQGLLDYCERDTLAMVRLADYLQGGESLID